MTSQESKLSRNPDFNMENIKAILITIDNETVLLNRVEYMKEVVSNSLPIIRDADLDAELLSVLMPHAKTTLENIFEKVFEVIYEDNEEEIHAQTLLLLQEYLQIVLILYDVLKEIFDFIHGRNTISFSNIISLPLYTTKILYATFLHCKEGDNIYKNYFQSLKEIVLIFKKAQEIHSNLLNVLENCLTYNVLCEAEILSLSNVLDNLTEIGDVLSGLNVKSMADNWKTYMNLAQKYADKLNKSLDLGRPLLFFTSEIVKSLHNILEMNLNDKDITHTLKISNFFLRVMLKLCDAYPIKVALQMKILWNFFIDFYSVYSPAMKSKRFTDNTSDLLKTLVCNGLEQFLIKLIQYKEFFDTTLLTSLIVNRDSAMGFMLVTNIVLQKLVNQGYRIADIDIAGYVDVIFTAMRTCYILFMKEDKLYEELLISFVHLTFLSTNEQFLKIELILWKNLMTTSIWNSLFAYDAWNMICRICNMKYTFDTLCWIIENFDAILKTHYTFRPQFVILTNFTAELYKILGNNYKLKFLEKYPLNTNLYVWRHIGLKNFPNSCLMQIENLLADLCQKMEKFDTASCTYDEYLDMMDMMNIFVSAPFDEVYFDLKKMNMLLKKLWDFDATNKFLLESKMFRLYLETICKLTVNLMWRLNFTELIHILNQLKQIIDYDGHSKPLLLFLIRPILNRSSDYSQDKENILLTTSELLTSLLIDENIAIKASALELIQKAANNTTWNEIPRDIAAKYPHLKRLISNFTNKKLTNNVNCLKTYIKLEKAEFRHECLASLPVGPVLKKQKVSVSMENARPNVSMENALPNVAESKFVPDNVEATRLLQKIRKDVQYLGRLVGRSDLTEQNAKDINFILKELQSYT